MILMEAEPNFAPSYFSFSRPNLPRVAKFWCNSDLYAESSPSALGNGLESSCTPCRFVVFLLVSRLACPSKSHPGHQWSGIFNFIRIPLKFIL